MAPLCKRFFYRLFRHCQRWVAVSTLCWSRPGRSSRESWRRRPTIDWGRLRGVCWNLCKAQLPFYPRATWSAARSTPPWRLLRSCLRFSQTPRACSRRGWPRWVHNPAKLTCRGDGKETTQLRWASTLIFNKLHFFYRTHLEKKPIRNSRVRVIPLSDLVAF